MAVYYSWDMGVVERLRHLGNEKIWAALARENGRGVRLGLVSLISALTIHEDRRIDGRMMIT